MSGSIEAFIVQLVDRGVKFRLVDGKVRLRATTGTLTPELKQELASRKDEIQAFLSTTTRPTWSAAACIPRRHPNHDQALPLSFAQRRLWFLDRLDAGDTADYSMPLALQLRGRLDVGSLQQALTYMVERHESLRTSFGEFNDQPAQIVGAPHPATLEQVDLSSLEPKLVETLARDLVQVWAYLPFSLEHDRLYRVRIIRLTSRDWVLFVNFHHIVADAWSLDIFATELLGAYAALCRGKHPRLPELEIQYPDYAIWQQELEGGEQIAAALSYWQQQLTPLPPHAAFRPLPHPWDRSGGASYHFEINSETSQKLRQFVGQTESSMFSTLLAGFFLLIANYCREQDLCIGIPIAGRDQLETQSLIGFFVNVLPLRMAPYDHPHFRALAEATARCVHRALDHGQAPLEHIVERLRRHYQQSHENPRDLPPLFSTFFNFLGSSRPNQLDQVQRSPQFAGLQIQGFDLDFQDEKFDFNATVSEGRQTIKVTFQYKRCLFDDEAIARMARHYQNILVAGIHTASRLPSCLPMLTREEWQPSSLCQPIQEALPEPLSLHGLFRKVARQQGSRPALLSLSGTLSYAELDALSDAMALQLGHYGVGLGDTVAILAERSNETIAVILAILKTGSAYLTLDPIHPNDRLLFMMNDTAAKFLVSEDPTFAELTAVPFLTLVEFVRESRAQLNNNKSAPRIRTIEELPAYVMYTSGSTGKPKGVVVSHRAVIRLVFGLPMACFSPNSVVLNVTSLSFDPSIIDLFGGLLHGGSCVPLAPKIPEPSEITEVIQEFGVNTAWLTSALFNSLVDQDVMAFSGMKYLLIGGEALSPIHVRQFLHHHPETLLMNGYGPTEATVLGAYHPIAWSETCRASIPIGRPIGHTYLRIVDQAGLPAPPGAPGELLIGGIGLANGYLNRPRITAESFIPDPLAETPGARLYRTGDLVRLLPDHHIDYLGRTDFQVKIHGYRIEPKEIAEALKRHPAVEETAAVVVQPAQGPQKIIAFVVAPEGNASQFAEFLRESIPEFMVPAHIWLRKNLPINANGKLDRQVLLAEVDQRLAQDKAEKKPLVLPQTHVQHQLHAIWREVLDLDQLSMDDHFFGIGGHSLLATRLVSRVRQRFAIDLPLRELFDKPTLSAFAAVIASRVAKDSPEHQFALAQVPGNEPLPLSFAQERLWLIDRLHPGTPTYNVALFPVIEGPFGVQALWGAFNYMRRRHAILRTIFAMNGDTPIQVIQPYKPQSILVIDLSGLAEQTRQKNHEQLMVAEYQIRFALDHSPPIRSNLVRLERSQHGLLINLHHIITDAWSIQLFQEQLLAAYQEIASGSKGSLALNQEEASPRYVDFAYWQRQRLQGEAMAGQLAYWREKLTPVPQPLTFPTENYGSLDGDQTGRSFYFTIPAKSSAGIRELTLSQGATPYMAMLTIFQIVLARYCDQSRFAIGTPIAGRNHLFTEKMLGFFVNTLVHVVDMEPQMSFVDLLAQTRRDTLEAFAHQDLPFEKLVEDLPLERDLSRPPLFQAFFNFHEGTPSKKDTTDHRSQSEKNGEPTGFATLAPAAKFELSLTVENGETMACHFHFRCRIFADDTIQRMAEHIAILVEQVLERPDRPALALDIATNSDRANALHFGPKKTDICSNTIHDLFHSQVQLTPEQPALAGVSAKLRQITYGQLDEWCQQISNLVSYQGVDPGNLVAILCPRGAKMIAALLGILKSGAAYLALEPEAPTSRMKAMLEEAAVSLVLVDPILGYDVETLALPNLKVIAIPDPQNSLPSATNQERHTLQAPKSTAHFPAYVVFTSGSTGKPKGVVVSHGAAANYAQSIIARIGCGVGDHHAMVSTLAADLGLTVVFAALLSGGCLHVLDEQAIRDPFRFAAYLKDHCIDYLKIVPSHLQALQIELKDEPPMPRKGVIVGGEATPPAWAAQVHRHHPQTTWLNHYGPSETTIGTLTCAIPPHEIETKRTFALGQPLPNTSAYVLNHHLLPVPVGGLGELFIAGTGLAQGYLAKPAETADRFLPDPFSSSQHGGRMYRSGDLVRASAQGRLEFRGRVDFQLKIRGHRVEIGEIEANLRRIPGIDATVVSVFEDAGGEPTLISYVVPDSPENWDEREVRNLLARELPSYMMPHQFILLPQLPLNPNGKVDRTSLPRPTRPREAAIAPRSSHPIEAILQSIWADLLRRPQIDVHDHFFQIGGHSLLATRLSFRIRTTFQVDLPLRTLFEHPRIVAQAKLIALASREDLPAAPLLQKAPRDQLLPLSYGQQRLWFLQQLHPNQTAYHVPFVHRIEGKLDAQIFGQALNMLVARHEVMRTIYPSVAGQPVQKILVPAPNKQLALSDLSGHELCIRFQIVRHQMNRMLATNFELDKHPPWRARLFRLNENDHVIALVMHHIMTDAWSRPILWHELQTLYLAAVRQVPHTLPPLAYQYSDYAVWQRQYLDDSEIKAGLNYWKTALGEQQPVLALPHDFQRPSVPKGKGNLYQFHLKPALCEQLQAMAQQQNTTPFIVFLTAFQIILHHYSRQTDVRVGIPVSGRNHEACEALIGFFVNTLVIRAKVQPGQNLRGLLEQIRSRVLAAFSHADTPFEKLVEALEPERETSHSPLFQAMFNYQALAEPAPNHSGEIAPNSTTSSSSSASLESMIGLESHYAKFDITLSVDFHLQGSQAVFEYATELFLPETIITLAGHLLTLLERFPKSLDDRIIDFDYGIAGSACLSVPATDLVVSGTASGFLPQLVEEQAQRTPNAIAVASADHQLTYSELIAISNQFTHQLMAFGVGPEACVGVFMSRRIEIIPLLLGIMKTGAAFLPLDAASPVKRVKTYLQEARAKLLIHDETIQHLCSLDIPCRQLALAQLQRQANAGAQSSCNPPTIHPYNPAYVIFTSGSTGRPKGVVVTHASIAKYITSSVEAYGVEHAEGAPWLGSLAFDATQTSLWTPLMVGGKVVLLDQQDPIGDLAGQLQRGHHYSPIKITPAHLALLNFELARTGAQVTNGTFVIGGEQLLWKELDQLTKHAPSSVFVNEYGPTEATVGCAVHRQVYDNSYPAPQGRGSAVPIGFAIENARLYVLNQAMMPRPLDIPGELFIGGTCLARGYLNAPSLTAERFIPDPFSTEKGARMYRSGDLVRHRAQHGLQYLGRRDGQVKLRGYRIEPEEISAHLGTHPAVRDCAVVLHQESGAQAELVAYLILNEQATEQPDREIATQWRDHCHAALPGYMVPRHFLVVAELPLTTNGKLDPRRLPTPRALPTSISVNGRPLQGAMEHSVAEHFAQTLGTAVTDADAHFFRLGGHSLAALQLVDTLNRRYHRQLAVIELFQNPTVRQLARLLDKGETMDGLAENNLVCLQDGGSGTPLFLVHAIIGDVFCYLPLVRALGKDRPVFGFQAEGLTRLPGQLPAANLAELATRYLSHVTGDGPIHLGGWSMGGLIALEMARQLWTHGRRDVYLFLIDSYPETVAKSDFDDSFSLLYNFATHLGFPVTRTFFEKTGTIKEGLSSLSQLTHHRQPTERLDLQRLDFLFSLYREHLGLLFDYRPQAYPGRVVQFHARGRAALTQTRWDGRFTNLIARHSLNGNHHELIRPPLVLELASKLDSYLNQPNRDPVYS